jgi:hypothetical protein
MFLTVVSELYVGAGHTWTWFIFLRFHLRWIRFLCAYINYNMYIDAATAMQKDCKFAKV